MRLQIALPAALCGLGLTGMLVVNACGHHKDAAPAAAVVPTPAPPDQPDAAFATPDQQLALTQIANCTGVDVADVAFDSEAMTGAAATDWCASADKSKFPAGIQEDADPVTD